jgi:phytoene desaturase
VEDRLLPGFGLEIETSHLLSPADWARRGMMAGTPFSYAHSFAQTGPFRPRNFPRRGGNVVLAGGGTTPGVGVPTVLISGRLAADRITGVAQERRGRTLDLSAGGRR